jgi:cytosine/adenosine deaminase-related metal-dependent hydrolase
MKGGIAAAGRGRPRIVRATAVLPGHEPPIRDGAVVVDEDGTILDVGRASDLLPRHAGAEAIDVGGVLLPGLVNAHTHLELSALRGKVTGGRGFVPWLESFLAGRAAELPEENDEAIQKAVADAESTGTAAVGDVTNSLAAAPALARHRMAGVLFHELFGWDRDKALARLPAMREQRHAIEPFLSDDLACVPAPHTLYTTHPDVVRALVAAARDQGARTTLHLAEHPAERSFLVDRTGPYFDFAVKMRLSAGAFPISGAGPVETADRLGLLAPDVMLVHLTDARPEELDRIAAARAPVVICPRSNLFIEVKLPPLPAMLRAGIVPALGTDSLASNASLDVLQEARALSDRFPSLPPWTLLRMATDAGARVLGRADLGRLERGACPGLLSIEGTLEPDDDPSAWVLRHPRAARRWVARRRSNGAPAGPLGNKAAS